MSLWVWIVIAIFFLVVIGIIAYLWYQSSNNTTITPTTWYVIIAILVIMIIIVILVAVFAGGDKKKVPEPMPAPAPNIVNVYDAPDGPTFTQQPVYVPPPVMQQQPAIDVLSVQGGVPPQFAGVQPGRRGYPIAQPVMAPQPAIINQPRVNGLPLQRPVTERIIRQGGYQYNPDPTSVIIQQPTTSANVAAQHSQLGYTTGRLTKQGNVYAENYDVGTHRVAVQG